MSPPGGATLRERLATELDVAFDRAPDTVSLHSSADLGTTVMEYDVLVGVTGGSLSMQANGADQLLVTSLAADLSDLEISPEAFPPDGITFTDFHVELLDATSGPAEWSEADDRATATITGDLGMDWSVVQDTGEPLPLARQTVTDVTIEIDAQRDASSAITVAVVATHPGDFFTWSDLVTLSELSMQLGGTTSD